MLPTAKDRSVGRPTAAGGQVVGLFEAAWRHRLALGIVVTLTTVCSYLVALLLPPTYKANAILIIPDAGNAPFSQNSLPADRGRYLATQAQRITSTAVTTAVASAFGDGTSSHDVASALSAEPGVASDTLTITATARSAVRASRLANAAAAGYLAVMRDEARASTDAAATRLQGHYDEVRRKLEQADAGPPSADKAAAIAGLQEQLKSVSAEQGRLLLAVQEYQPPMYVGRKAATPSRPVSPVPLRDAGLAALIAIMVSCAAVWSFDTRSQRRADVGRFTSALGAACLGRLSSTRKLAAHDSSAGALSLAGQWQQVVSAVDASLRGVKGRCVLVTSPVATEQGSESAARLALSAAEDGRSVVLVDADPATRQLSTAAGAASIPGLTEMVEEDGEIWGSVGDGAGLRPTVAVLSAGRPVPNSAALYRTAAFRTKLASVGQNDDLVLVVGPPVLDKPDAIVLADAADAVLLVVPESVTDEQLRETRARLSWSRGELLGYVVVEQASRRSRSVWWRPWLALRRNRGQTPAQESARTSFAALLKPLHVVPRRAHLSAGPASVPLVKGHRA
jgi:Mrp family chromosome partitioning ATPase